jgi:hypothetical protein
VDWVRALCGPAQAVGAASGYVRFVEAGVGLDRDTLARFESKPALGDGVFVRGLDEHARATTQCAEFPRVQRFMARPELARLFADATTRAGRNARAVIAVRDHGYAMREVADFIGRHYVTVSRALARADGLPPRGKNVGM